MALCDGVVWVIRKLCTTNNMAPVDTDPVSSLDTDDRGRDGCSVTAVAGNVSVVDVRYGVVGVGHADSD